MSTPTGYRRVAPDAHPPNAHPAYASTHKRAPAHEPIRLAHTLPEITGPGVGREIVRAGGADISHCNGGDALGERIIVSGRVQDEDGRGTPHTLIEIWQANAAGRYDHPEDTQEKLLDAQFHGFGRAATDAGGWYHFHTIKPGPVPGNDATSQAPHLKSRFSHAASSSDWSRASTFPAIR